MVTKQEQLEWLAKNWCLWVHSLGDVYMSKYMIGQFVGMTNDAHQINFDEWQQERDKMQKQQPTVGDEVYSALQENSKKDNSWHERGELPPVGCECEFVEFSENDLSRGVSSGDAVEILAHYSPCSDNVSVAVFSYKVNSDRQRGRLVDQAVSSCFRPLRAEREKAIDEMKALCAYPGSWDSTYKAFAEALYDAGYRKQE